MKKLNLTAEEKELERRADELVPASAEELDRIGRIVDRARKSRSITLRISTYDLEKIKEKAELEGLGYQTLINVVLHKYVTNQLYDKKEVIKTVNAIRAEDGNIT